MSQDKLTQDIKQIVGITQCTQEEALQYYYQCDKNLERTVQAVMDRSIVGQSGATQGPMTSEDAQLQKAQMESLKTHQQHEMGITPGDQDAQLQKALMESLNQGESNMMHNEPLPIDQRLREGGKPPGLVNFGNACYFNSLVQALFHIPEFVEIVMQFDHQEERKKPENFEDSKKEEDKKEESKAMPSTGKYKYRLLENFQILFGKMIKSEKTYQDARECYNVIWENNKTALQTKGEQMDLSEFYLYFHKDLFESFEVPKADPDTDVESKEESKEESKDAAPPDLEMKKNESVLGGDEEMEPENEQDMEVDNPNSPIEIAEKKLRELFCGKQKSVMIYGENNENTSTRAAEEFISVNLLPKNKDLYSAWDDDTTDNISGYKPDEGQEPTDATKIVTISELPKFLMFNILRAGFDDKGIPTKNNDRFDFDEVIYPDRYYERNFEEANKVRNKVEELRNKVHTIQDHLEKFNNHKNKGIGVASLLQLTSDLVKSANEDIQIENPHENVEVFMPEHIFNTEESGLTNEKINEIVNYLMVARDSTFRKIERMEEQLKDLQDEIVKSYQHIDNEPYYLHSLMIHEGTTESGHYYTFVKNFKDNSYLKLNDYRVEEVNNEEVERCSKGGNGVMNAYTLVYVHRDIHAKLSQSTFNTYVPQSDDYYNKLVSDDMCATIFEEDLKLKAEIEDSKVAEKAKKVKDLYEKRIKTVQQFKEEHSTYNKYNYASIVLSFDQKTKVQNDFWHLGKWFLFNQCYKEALGTDEDMINLPSDDKLRNKLAEIITSGGDNYPTIFSLTDEGIVKVSEITGNYKDNLITAIICCEVFSDLVYQDYTGAVRKIMKRFSEIQDLNKINFLRDGGRVSLIRLTSQINELIIKGEAFEQKILPILITFVQVYGTTYTDYEDLHYKQVCANLRATLDVARDKLGENAAKFEELVTILENKNFGELQIPENLLPSYGEDLDHKISEVRSMDFIQKWHDVYSEKNIMVTFEKGLGEFRKNLEKYIETHKRLVKKANGLFSAEDFFKIEEEHGINLRQFCAE
ncbi:unnamed protein product [Moneuplotes crassus]|uniref:USP domain-containing protein n=3 Tax=Euplotes crassus TaxID=5936 RepID=A0AAD2D0I0_EUPCR|nr:unnamed protein product [Moneuplotes crassus]